MHHRQNALFESSTCSQEPLRLAVIGVGIAGQSHLLDAVTTPSIEVVAICARHLEHALHVASDFGIPAAYSDLKQMLAEQHIHAAVVASPPGVLATHTATCLRAGIDVLSEKPLATHRYALQELADAERTSGRNLIVAYTRRYRTAWAAAREWIASNQIGSIVRIECHWSGPYRSRYSSDATTYRADPKQRVAGVMLNSGSHALDAVLYLTGAIGGVANAELQMDQASEVDVEGTVVLQHPGGASIILNFQDGAHEETKFVRIKGTAGEISIDDEAAHLHQQNGFSTKVVDSYHRRPIEDLIAARHGEPTCGASLSEAAEITRCLIRLYKMAGQPLSRSWQRPRAKALARLSGAC